jgi:hypothetical protein
MSATKWDDGVHRHSCVHGIDPSLRITDIAAKEVEGSDSHCWKAKYQPRRTVTHRDGIENIRQANIRQAKEMGVALTAPIYSRSSPSKLQLTLHS